MPKINDESTNKLLKVIIALLVRSETDSTRRMREQIRVLKDLGMRPTEISEVLGRTSSYVNKEFSEIKKEAR